VDGSIYRVQVRDEDRVRAGLVVQLVALASGLTPEAVLDIRRRDPAASQARRTAMYLTHVAYGWTLERVGHAFGRNRVTVGTACQRVEDERDAPDIDARLERLTELLAAALAAAGEAAS
jgi:chromosomal replication initiation ATPase DnaA